MREWVVPATMRAGWKGWSLFARGALLATLAAVAVLALSGSAADAGMVAAHARSVATSRRALVRPLTVSPDGALDLPPRMRRPAICLPLPTGARMWTQAQLAQPRVPGHAYDELGRVGRCEWDGLPAPDPAGGAPALGGQVILVSLAQQWLWAYQDGQLVFTNPITSGQPKLVTPLGEYQVRAKVADTTFYSPWGPWSPYYYAPEHVSYALLFRTGGYYLHDAPWRGAFGPGTNIPHTDPNGARETGSHGCVNLTTAAAAWLYHWANVGATVLIVP
ncbi:MAG TPA: L,D-transpeptidase family protein [Ktedonobacterales bacterium]